MPATMSYDGSGLSPVPFMNITRNYDKTADGTQLGVSESITLNGTLTPLPTGTTGLVAITDLQDNVRSIFADDGKRFLVQCDAATVLDVYPKVNSISFPESSNNWVMTAPFTVELEYEPTDARVPPYISTASEEWNLEVVEDRSHYSVDLSTVTDQQPTYYYNTDANPFQFRVSHTLAATGKKHYDSGGVVKEAWQQAQDYVTGRMGLNLNRLSGTDFNLDLSVLSGYNHIRTRSIGELDGTYNLTETWLVVNPTGVGVAGRATEDFTIDVREGLENGATSVGIQGSIQGLESVNYGTTSGDYAIDETKYVAATGYWGTVKTRLYSRAQYAMQNSVTADRILNINPRSTSIGHNLPNGTINYSYEYDDRPSNCISGAKTESITINDNHPTDIFASLTVLGRSGGPVLQDIGTVTAATREVSIEAVMEQPTGCSVANLLTNRPTTQVNSLLCQFQTDLTTNYEQVFKNQDTESWNPKTGRYNRNIGWTYQASGVGIITSVC